MARLTDAERKAEWAGSRFKNWRGEVHYEVLTFDGPEFVERGLFEEREDAEKYIDEQEGAGLQTSGVQLRKGSFPEGDGD